jgi:hypothetical protein
MQNSSMTTSDTASELGLFLTSLAEEGRAVVSPNPLSEQGEDAALILKQLDAQARDELGLEAPEFSAAPALWAARLFYSLCQFTTCRDIGEEQIAAACAVPCPATRGPSADWSADLVLRHLPRLFQLARQLSNADPLLDQMRAIATAWPLSSVGIQGLDPLSLDSFSGHPALRRLYADRIIACGDLARLGDARVDDLLRADLGEHRALAPAIASQLFRTTHDTD